MGNACGSNVKKKLETGQLYLRVDGFPEGLAPIGDIESPFGIDPAIPVSADATAHRASRAGTLNGLAGHLVACLLS